MVTDAPVVARMFLHGASIISCAVAAHDGMCILSRDCQQPGVRRPTVALVHLCRSPRLIENALHDCLDIVSITDNSSDECMHRIAPRIEKRSDRRRVTAGETRDEHFAEDALLVGSAHPCRIRDARCG